MSDPLARSRRITRRTFGVAALAVAGLVFARWRPSLVAAPTGIESLAGLPQAPALKALGARPDAAALGDVTARLTPKLADISYANALARDRAAGAILVVDGWRLPETQVLAAVYLAGQS